MHDSLDYMSHEPVHRKYHHDEMTFSMVYAYSENYVLPISHDEVVHGKGSLVSKMPGDWWQQRANHRAYLGYMWAHPGKQLLFMGQEFAQGAEWSHDTRPGLVAAGRRLSGGRRPPRRAGAGRATSTGSTRPRPALWQRDTDPAGFGWIDGGAADDNVLRFVALRRPTAGRWCASATSPRWCGTATGSACRRPDAGAGCEVLNTDDAAYGGSGVGNGAGGPVQGRGHRVARAAGERRAHPSAAGHRLAAPGVSRCPVR